MKPLQTVCGLSPMHQNVDPLSIQAPTPQLSCIPEHSALTLLP